MAAQWPRWRRLQMADDVVCNGGTEGELEAIASPVDFVGLYRQNMAKMQPANAPAQA